MWPKCMRLSFKLIVFTMHLRALVTLGSLHALAASKCRAGRPEPRPRPEDEGEQPPSVAWFSATRDGL